MDGHYSKLYRKIKTSDIWKCHANTIKVFVYLLNEANWKADATGPRGTFKTTEREIARQCYLSRESVRATIKNLKKHGVITQTTTHKATTITVLNYGKYQDGHTQRATTTTTNQATIQGNQQEVRRKDVDVSRSITIFIKEWIDKVKQMTDSEIDKQREDLLVSLSLATNDFKLRSYLTEKYLEREVIRSYPKYVDHLPDDSELVDPAEITALKNKLLGEKF